MQPRVACSSHVQFRSALRGQGRFAASGSKRQGPQVSRLAVVAFSSRLVLNPTGNGSCDHIGDKVPLPAPIPLTDGVYEVGRVEPADIVLPIPTVSSRHALLRVEAERVTVTDLNSTNGTVVDGQELTAMDNVPVEPGSTIIFGDQYLAQFQLSRVSESEAKPAAMAVDEDVRSS